MTKLESLIFSNFNDGKNSLVCNKFLYFLLFRLFRQSIHCSYLTSSHNLGEILKLKEFHFMICRPWRILLVHSICASSWEFCPMLVILLLLLLWVAVEWRWLKAGGAQVSLLVLPLLAVLQTIGNPTQKWRWLLLLINNLVLLGVWDHSPVLWYV